MFEEKVGSVERSLTAERQRRNDRLPDDKEALTALLKYGFAPSAEKGLAVDLATSEEISRLVPLLCAYFSREELVELLSTKLAVDIFTMHQTEVLQNLFLEHALQDILHAFHEANIPLLLLKGAALAYTVYPQPRLRTYHDIDALIHPHDLVRAGELLSKMGYSYYEEYRTNVVDSKRTGFNYLKKQPGSWLEVLIELHTAPHSSEIGTQFDIAALWEKAQPLEILGETALTMDPINHLLYLCWHYRFHGFSRLLWLYDLVTLVRTTGGSMDWNELVQGARQQKLASTLYYCLCWCRDLFGVAIPASAFTSLRPPLLCRLVVERFALHNTALVLSAVQFRGRRMLARRVMVDSLGDVCKAGWRVLFPSRASIGRRYMEHSRLPFQLFFLYYFIHLCTKMLKGGRHLVKYVVRHQMSL